MEVIAPKNPTTLVVGASETVPKEIDLDKINSSFLVIDQVIDTHHTHIWSLDSEYHVLTTHLVVDKNTTLEEYHNIKSKVRKSCKELKIEHLTIQIDYENESCNYNKKSEEK